MAGRIRRAGAVLRDGAKRAFRAIPGALCDLVGFAGAAAIAYGAWLIYAPAGFLVGGVLMIAVSMLVGRRIDAKEKS